MKTKIASPYIVGVPVPPKMFYGYEDQVAQFYRQCISGPVLQPTRILGLRRSGKTSFLKYISSSLVPEEIFQEFVKDQLLFVYLDLEYVLSPLEFFAEVAEIIDEESNSSEFHTSELKTAYAFNKWLKNYFRVVKDKKLIILLDEFEKINNNPNFDSDFFGLLRSLASSHSERLTWVTASVIDLHTLNKDDKTSPLWNIFRNTPITMNGLSPKSSERLIKEPAKGQNVNFSKTEILEIQSVAGRIPYFVQAVSDEWFQCKLAGHSRKAIKTKVLSKLREPTNQVYIVINGYWDRMTEEKKAALMDIAIGRQIFSQNSNMLNELMGYGLVYDDHGEINISGELIKQFIVHQLDHKTSHRKEITKIDRSQNLSDQKKDTAMPTINVFVDSSIGQVRQNEKNTVADGSMYIAGDSQFDIGLNNDNVKQLFETLASNISKQTELVNADKDDLRTEVEELCQELDKNAQVNEPSLRQRLRNIGRMAPDILEVALATITNPAAGFGIVAKKVAEKVKSSAG